ncbi:2-C-methyl-D-erythritol 4-phosphate cytidylyltransferase [Alkalibaculum sp. M08DMB]|uniref:2-C-methyl-D-erythritol 4-phosphate cytidylyltransferase n=1 Tax=Alkalibaculum sporogenes TaxID=2655001 RepID=A0A6A7KBM2_9FIRM|nr:2-C-methyl-D-erythritol 4-phosphate cytidylyltransferase [Alkalibaculum sporogenes]MPW26806.1 2-C-methyl-D-erythritol 4-phosphate cytidylyltransferase [Alkalibaculum sporogenes]
MPRPFVSSIIVAAGSGSRMQAGVNKQYLYLSGKPVLAHTLLAFEKCELVDEIILVIGKKDIDICKEEVIRNYKIKKVKLLVEGGDTRQDSMYSGLKEVNPKADIVITHDGARPLIHQNTLIKCIEGTLEHKATIVAVPVKDTIKIVDDELNVKNTPKRSTLWTVQTPQTFDYDLLMKAHKQAVEDNFIGTDDAMLVERLNQPVKIIKGHYDNIKITTPEDLIMAESIIKIIQT